MMKKLLLLLAFTAGFSFWSCDDKDNHEIARTPSPTTLELTVKDETGNPVPGAVVKLYASEQDWNDQTNQIGATLTSDANGKVLFSDLIDMNYYFFAEKDCLNNVNGVHVTAAPLVLETNNKSDIRVGETGSIEITKHYSWTCSVFVNGNFVFNMAGVETKYVHNLSAGEHYVTVTTQQPGITYPSLPPLSIGCGDVQQIVIN